VARVASCAFAARIIEISFDIQCCGLAFAAACRMSASASGAFRSIRPRRQFESDDLFAEADIRKSPPFSRSTIRRVPFRSAAR